MKEKELYLGFKDPMQIQAMKHLENYLGDRAKDIINQYLKNETEFDVEKGLTDERKAQQEQQTKQWCDRFKRAINENLQPSSQAVQAIINEHYETRVKPFCDMSKDEFAQMFKAEQDLPEFKAKYDVVHPKMADFILAAVQHYAVNI